jgi:hypothetical protein
VEFRSTQFERPQERKMESIEEEMRYNIADDLCERCGKVLGEMDAIGGVGGWDTDEAYVVCEECFDYLETIYGGLYPQMEMGTEELKTKCVVGVDPNICDEIAKYAEWHVEKMIEGADEGRAVFIVADVPCIDADLRVGLFRDNRQSILCHLKPKATLRQWRADRWPDAVVRERNR